MNTRLVHRNTMKRPYLNENKNERLKVHFTFD